MASESKALRPEENGVDGRHTMCKGRGVGFV